MKRSEGAEMCDMRGMLSFMVLWLLSNRPMCGEALATEIGRRKGDKPNPGTIYPALKELSSRGWVRAHPDGRTLVYELTPSGRVSLSNSLKYFRRSFSDIFHPVPKEKDRFAAEVFKGSKTAAELVGEGRGR